MTLVMLGEERVSMCCEILHYNEIQCSSLQKERSTVCVCVDLPPNNNVIQHTPP